MSDPGPQAPNEVPLASLSTAEVFAVARSTPHGFERATSPLVGGIAGVVAVASAVAIPSLARPQSSAEVALLVVTAVALLGALFALQIQAAIFVLRDQRYAVASIGAFICAIAPAAAIFGLTHEETTPALTVAAAASTLYVALLLRYKT